MWRQWWRKFLRIGWTMKKTDTRQLQSELSFLKKERLCMEPDVIWEVPRFIFTQIESRLKSSAQISKLIKLVFTCLLYAVTLSRVSEGSEVHFLVKGVFSPISPCLGDICSLSLHYHVDNPRLNKSWACHALLYTKHPPLNKCVSHHLFNFIYRLKKYHPLPFEPAKQLNISYKKWKI